MNRGSLDKRASVYMSMSIDLKIIDLSNLLEFQHHCA